MINLEEEARKRRERLKSAFSNSSESLEVKKETEAASIPVEQEAVKEEDEAFKVPEGELLFDSSGAEILSLDSKYENNYCFYTVRFNII